MSRTGQQRRRAATDPHVVRYRATWLVILLLAAVLTLTAAGQVWALIERLPARAAARVDWDLLRDQQSRVTGDARAGWFHAVISSNATRCLRAPSQLAAVIRDARAARAALGDSGFLALQLAALQMWQLDHNDVPPELWWPRVAPRLRDIDPAHLAHHTEALLQAHARLISHAGVGPGTARSLAHLGYGAVHGPLLQGFAERTRRMEAALADTDPDAARACARARRMLLRQLVLEPGPAGPRLLGADLLARDLDDAGNTALATKLRDWYRAFHERARTLPVVPLPLRISHEPIPRPAAAALATTMTLGLSVAGAVVVAAIVAIMLAGAVLGGAASLRLADGAIGALPALVTLGLLTLITASAPAFMQRALLSPEWTDWSVPTIVGVLIAFGLLLVMYLPQPRIGSSRTGRTGRAAAISWLVLGVALLVLCGRAESQRQAFEQAGAGSRAELLQLVADPHDNGLIADLRAWRP